MKRSAHHPICPKCGYDQSGEIATWESSCPVNGVCPECGLAFEWADIFDRYRNHLNWYIEHAPSSIAFTKRSLPTLWRLMLPWVFWRSVTITHAISIRRLVPWILIVWVVLHIITAIPFAYYNWHAVDMWFFGTVQNAYQSYGIQGFAAILTNALCSPVIHVCTGPNGLTYTFEGGGLVYLSTTTSDLLVGLIAVIGYSTTWGIVLLAIPTTRNIAKIRTSHILRAYCLSLLPGIVIIEILRFESAYGMVARVTPSLLMPYGILICMVWLIVFWACALRVGWRVHRAWLLIVLGTIAATLGMAVFLLIPEVYL